MDHDPGNIEIVIGTEVEKRLTFTLSAGEVRYVKCTAGFGLVSTMSAQAAARRRSVLFFAVHSHRQQ